MTDFSYNFDSGANNLSRPVTIAIDAMGGDHGIESAIPGAAIVLREQVVRFIIFGDETRITNALRSHSDLKTASTIVHTDKMVRNDEKPSMALRNGKDTSMRLAIEAVEQGRADAVVSSGNTGALMAMAKMILRPLPGIHRPALASTFPTMKGSVVMLDLGANVLVDAENLVQFAVMGATFARSYKAIHHPTVGLLNVGSEDMKGPDHVRAAAAILSRIEFSGRYHGFVEGDDITKGTVDVIVSDGYTGNIALKTGEGVGAMTSYFFKQSMTGDPLSMLGGFLASFAIKRFKKRIDPRNYNGGVFLGLNGICVKSHGGADATGFSSAVTMAVRLARHGYTKQVSADIERLMGQDSFVTV